MSFFWWGQSLAHILYVTPLRNINHRVTCIYMYVHTCTRTQPPTCTSHSHISAVGTAHAPKPCVCATLEEWLLASACDVVQPHIATPSTKGDGPTVCSSGPWVPEGGTGDVGLCQGPVGVTYGTIVAVVEYLHTT